MGHFAPGDIDHLYGVVQVQHDQACWVALPAVYQEVALEGWGRKKEPLHLAILVGPVV